MKAVDGCELRITDEVRTIFAPNDFQFRRGVLACALSHIGLWKQLVEDAESESYIIVEDDITVCAKFKELLKMSQLAAESNEACDILFLGFFLNAKSFVWFIGFRFLFHCLFEQRTPLVS